ncbi:MAG: glycosyltransferase family 2 protein [Thermoleophilaceae bacterium]
MTEAERPRLSIVIVLYNEAERMRRCLPALVPQLREGDELVLSDNGSTDETLEVVAEHAPDAKVVENGGNIGFASACNRGADHAQGDLLVLLNPDTIPAPGWADALRRPAVDGRNWAAWQPLLTMDGGTRVNTSGGTVHFTGIAWARQMGEPIDVATREPHVTGFVSGGCFVLPLASWREHGGFPEPYFIYHEDTDLSLRLRLEGGVLGVEPAALLEHEYEFSRRRTKWRLLERNRWATIIRTYPGPLLALLAPALFATEVALFTVALAGGWGTQKLQAAGDVLRWLPRLLRERRVIQARRAIGAAEFARGLTPDLDSRYLGRASSIAPLRWVLRAYWRLVLAALRA